MKAYDHSSGSLDRIASRILDFFVGFQESGLLESGKRNQKRRLAWTQMFQVRMGMGGGVSGYTDRSGD